MAEMGIEHDNYYTWEMFSAVFTFSSMNGVQQDDSMEIRSFAAVFFWLAKCVDFHGKPNKKETNITCCIRNDDDDAYGVSLTTH